MLCKTCARFTEVKSMSGTEFVRCGAGIPIDKIGEVEKCSRHQVRYHGIDLDEMYTTAWKVETKKDGRKVFVSPREEMLRRIGGGAHADMEI